MNQAELHRKLIAAARRYPPSERVPLTFEKRILARIRACPMADHWALWSQALWRAAAPCVAIMLLLGAWGWLTPAAAPPANDLSQVAQGSTAVFPEPPAGAPPATNLSQELENTMLAAAETEQSLDLSR
jgi:hypothetical protein